MSMTKEYIKKFVEEDYKDYCILVTCDNEHKFYHNAKDNPPIIWDWDNNTFTVLSTNQEIIDQNGHPMEVTTVSLEEIQFLTAYIDTVKALDFINTKITDETKKEEAKQMLQKIRPAKMGPNSLRDPYQYKSDVKLVK